MSYELCTLQNILEFRLVVVTPSLLHTTFSQTMRPDKALLGYNKCLIYSLQPIFGLNHLLSLGSV